jgi:hypothetical protein
MAHKKLAPQEIKQLKRELGVSSGGGAPSSYVKLTKTVNQSVSTSSYEVIDYEELTYNIGGGGNLSQDGLVVPSGMSGLWRVRSKCRTTAASITANAVYFLELNINGAQVNVFKDAALPSANAIVVFILEDLLLEEGDVVTCRFWNDSATTQTVLTFPGTYAIFEYLGIA